MDFKILFQAVMKTMNAQVQRVVSFSSHRQGGESEPTELKLHHLAGAFSLLAFGLLLALVVFVFENFLYILRNCNFCYNL